MLWNIRKDYRELEFSPSVPPPEEAIVEEPTVDLEEVLQKV